RGRPRRLARLGTVRGRSSRRVGRRRRMAEDRPDRMVREGRAADSPGPAAEAERGGDRGGEGPGQLEREREGEVSRQRAQGGYFGPASEGPRTPPVGGSSVRPPGMAIRSATVVAEPVAVPTDLLAHLAMINRQL